MAQPSVAHFYNSRKRKAVEDFKIDSAPKNLKLQLDETSKPAETVTSISHPTMKSLSQLLKSEPHKESPNPVRQKVHKSVVRQLDLEKPNGRSQSIQTFLNNMKKDAKNVANPQKTEEKTTKELDEIKKKLNKSQKLAELKASIARFKKSEQQLKAAEKKTDDLLQSPKLKTFKSINFEVEVSPSKTLSPEKLYLSPKKDSTVRRNLFNVSSPTKYDTRDVADSTQPSLQLPFKYKTLSEIFRAMDIVAQILYNRKELITFNKLKPAVEKMIKRNFVQKYLAQIKSIYPEAYRYTVEKLKAFGMGLQQLQWDLVITPNVSLEMMTTQLLLDRRRKLHQMLIEKIKHYHDEFLMSLTPPMIIPKDKIINWHPEFDIERVPDIELGELPQLPSNEKCATGKEILESARRLFNCNTRMNQALLNLKEMNEKASGTEEKTDIQPPSIIKGIPQALLEKVRQKQAAKALLSMTRTVDKEKELQMYSRLPEIARLTRNLFVTEKKGVLELDIIVEKLGNSYRSFINKKEIEDHLKLISEKVPDWLVFHKLRSSMYVKLNKNADLSLVLNKLEKLAKEKSES